jgi:hypothetical protein
MRKGKRGRQVAPPPAAGYLHSGRSLVWPGGWHLAPGSWGPLLLFPGPKSGSPKATAGSASIPTDAAIAASFLIWFHLPSLPSWVDETENPRASEWRFEAPR